MTSIQSSSLTSPLSGSNSARSSSNSTHKAAEAPLSPSPSTQVSLSSEGKALLQALKEIDQEAPPPVEKSSSFGDKVESFTHGALGLDPPKKDDEDETNTAQKQEQEDDKDDSYTAGKYAKAAATIGTILLAVI